MTLDEYRKPYIDLNLILRGAAGRQANCGQSLEEYPKRQADLINKVQAMFEPSPVSIVESTFLVKNPGWMKQLKNFEAPTGFPSNIYAEHLSCYIHIRDCFARNGDRFESKNRQK